MKIAYATFAGADRLDDPDLDRDLVLAAVRRRNVQIESCIWDDPTITWADFDAVVVRSTWDYVPKFQRFRQWLIDVDHQTLLLNPRMVIEPNLVKTYLRDLESRGIPIVPTHWLTSLEQFEMAGETVIKPVISAGAADTIRTSDPARGREHLDLILGSGRMAMAQPYLDEVVSTGEISIICIDGKPCWSVRKIPALTEGGHGGASKRVELSTELIDFALHALSEFPGASESLYARVDVVPTRNGLRLMELELAEPSLFIPLGPDDAADQLAEALITRL